MKIQQIWQTIIFRWVIWLLIFISLIACASVTPLPNPTTTAVRNTATSRPVPSPTPFFTPTVTPLNLHPQIFVLAGNLPEPDDLLLAPDGSIFISDVSEGTIKQYGLDGQLQILVSGLHAPEGMVSLPDGSLVIAEQGKNRLVRYDFNSKMLSLFLNLENNTGNLGVDGITWDGSNIIVPDSPNGKILAVAPDGGMVRQIASGLTRPTGAWAEKNGNLLIADEDGNAVFRLHPDGSLEKIGDFSIPDDVIEDTYGNIFVATLGDDAIHVILADSKQDVVLVSGLSDPQGIIFDTQGNLIATDAGHHQLIRVVIH